MRLGNRIGLLQPRIVCYFLEGWKTKKSLKKLILSDLVEKDKFSGQENPRLVIPLVGSQKVRFLYQIAMFFRISHFRVTDRFNSATSILKSDWSKIIKNVQLKEGPIQSKNLYNVNTNFMYGIEKYLSQFQH